MLKPHCRLFWQSFLLLYYWRHVPFFEYYLRFYFFLLVNTSGILVRLVPVIGGVSVAIGHRNIGLAKPAPLSALIPQRHQAGSTPLIQQ
jgi:hypothetical protein